MLQVAALIDSPGMVIVVYVCVSLLKNMLSGQLQDKRNLSFQNFHYVGAVLGNWVSLSSHVQGCCLKYFCARNFQVAL